MLTLPLHACTCTCMLYNVYVHVCGMHMHRVQILSHLERSCTSIHSQTIINVNTHACTLYVHIYYSCMRQLLRKGLPWQQHSKVWQLLLNS